LTDKRISGGQVLANLSDVSGAGQSEKGVGGRTEGFPYKGGT